MEMASSINTEVTKPVSRKSWADVVEGYCSDSDDENKPERFIRTVAEKQPRDSSTENVDKFVCNVTTKSVKKFKLSDCEDKLEHEAVDEVTDNESAKLGKYDEWDTSSEGRSESSTVTTTYTGRHHSDSFTTTSSEDANERYEYDACVLARRQKQIDYGKNTLGYDRYLQIVPKGKRTKNHPKTPPKHLKYSRRAWDGLVKHWRLKLHKYDPSDNPESIHEDPFDIQDTTESGTSPVETSSGCSSEASSTLSSPKQIKRIRLERE